MKNTLMLILLLATEIELHGQFNTIDQYGSNPRSHKTFAPVVNDSIRLKTKIQNFKSEPKTDLSIAKMETKFSLPLKSIKQNSSFGGRIHPISKFYKFHSGVDLKAQYEPVYSIAKGIVSQCGFRPIEGNFIKIKHGDIESVYCHLSELFVSIGESVRPGTTIGVSGNSGMSTGPHLHFGLKRNGKFLNPDDFLDLFY